MTLEDLYEVKMYGICVEVDDKKFHLTVFIPRDEEKASIELINKNEKYQWILPIDALNHIDKVLPVIKMNIKNHLIDRNFDEETNKHVASEYVGDKQSVKEKNGNDLKWN